MHFVIVGALGLAGWAAVDAFGWLHGLGVVAGLYVLLPYQPPRRD